MEKFLQPTKILHLLVIPLLGEIVWVVLSEVVFEVVCLVHLKVPKLYLLISSLIPQQLLY